MLKFNNILYVYSDSVDNKLSLDKAVQVAKYNQATLTVLYTLTNATIPDTLGFSQDDIETFIENKELERDKIIQAYADGLVIEKDTLLNNSYIDVIEKVQDNGFDLLIKPSENEGFLSKLFGSNDMGFLRQCPCPVLLFNPEEKQDSQTIVAAVDVDSNYPDKERCIREQLNLDIVVAAASVAANRGCKLKIVSAWYTQYDNSVNYAQYLKKDEGEVDLYLKNAEEQHHLNFEVFMKTVQGTISQETLDYVSVESVSIKGNPRESLPNFAKSVDAELVVMGTVARVGIKGLFIGNTAENILYRLNQSVLALKPEGFDSSIGS